MPRQSDGTGRREAWRQFLHASIAPVALGVAADLADKPDIPGLALNHERMMASDIAGKARAVQSLVRGGMDVAKAAALAGLMEPDETQPAPLGPMSEIVKLIEAREATAIEVGQRRTDRRNSE